MAYQLPSSQTSAYTLVVPEVAAGANKVMLDIFNGGTQNLTLLGLKILTKSDVAVTGAVSARFDVHRTATPGTGGTIATTGGTSTSVPNFHSRNSFTNTLPATISARSAPSGGAASTGWLFPVYQFTEETNAGAILQGYYNVLESVSSVEPYVFHYNEGLTIIQGSVASLNSFTFILEFTLA